MTSVFPLKAILDTKAARYLQDVAGVDSTNPRLLRKTFARGTLKKSVSIVSEKSSIFDYVDEAALEKKQAIIYCLGLIVEDAVDQMHILSSGRKSELCLQKLKLSLEERLSGMLYEDPVYDMETGDPYAVSFTKRKVNKNIDDCAICREFLTIIKNELKADKTYNSVKDIMNTIIKKMEAETTLLKEEANNFAKMKDYKHMIITHSRNYQQQMQSINELLASSEDEIQGLLFGNLLRVRYIRDWENAREEQNTLSCKKSEKELEDIISKYQMEIEKEIRTHTEIETYILENLTDLENDIKYWIARYDKEMESTNTQIQILKDRKEGQEKALQNLQELFTKHKKEIDDFKAYKEKKRLEAEELARKTAAAIKIQAWWRGNMVRHQLGPFNPNKKGKKGKDKDKKKKK